MGRGHKNVPLGPQLNRSVRLSILADIGGMLTEGGVPNAAKRQAIY